MELSDICSKFLTKPLREALANGLSGKETPARLALCNLAGSSVALALANVPHGESPLLVIGDSKDDAGYLYHDMSRLLGENSVLVFPSGYKRDIKYGQVDSPS